MLLVRCCVGFACSLLLACSFAPHATPGRASPRVDAAQQFSGFCDGWMKKLRDRERTNLAGIQLRAIGSRVTGKYTGYGNGALECSARKTGLVTTPFVGTLIYEEILYAKSGRTHSRARKSTPRALRTIEVTELFRHDGTRWLP